jgi:hypothetical protein
MPIEVLVVDENPGDVRLTREAFREANDAVRLNVAADGVETMAFLMRSGAHIADTAPGFNPAGLESAKNGWT